jgi:lysophospholipase L1-like esterase
MFAVLEAGVRILGIAPSLPRQYSTNVADPYLPWKPEPLSVSEGTTPEYRFSYRHNSVGFRDTEHTVRKPDGVFRILVLGDSFTYGVGVSSEATYVARLGRMLNAHFGGRQTVEMINAGIPRYWPEPERLLLEHYGLAYEPDVVIVAFLPNDVIDSHVGLRGLTVSQGFLVTRGLDPLGGVGVWLYRHSQVFRILFARYLAGRVDAELSVTTDLSGSHVYEAGGALEGDWQKVEREYDRMAELVHDAGAMMSLVFIAPHAPWPPIHHDYPQRRLDAWCKSRGVTCIDTAPALTAAATSNPLYYPLDGHPTSDGHAVIADAIYAALLRAFPQ